MSRPIKQGLDYFPMDVEMDDKFEFIEAKHGIVGFGIVVKLYQKIYKDGYFIRWTEDTALLFSKRINVNIKEIDAVIMDCLNYEIFNKKLFSEYKILTSTGIQRRYLFSISRRKEVNLYQNFIIADINGVTTNINWINDDISTHSIVKDSIVKDSIEVKSSFMPPNLEEVKSYFAENGYTEQSAIKAYNHYSLGNWYDSNGKPVSNWKKKMNLVWFKPESKIAEQKKWMPS